MRTDLLRACVPCRYRFAIDRPACPRCGGRDLCMAREWEKWRRFGPSRNLPIGAAAAMVIAGLAWSILTREHAGFLFGGLAVGYGSFLVALRRKWRLNKDVESLDLERTEMPPSQASWIRGRIVGAARATVAPLSGKPCVGFRLVGAMGLWSVDDADLAPFEMETPAGERLLVEPDPALVDVPVGKSPAAEGSAERLTAFLAPRGLGVADLDVEEGVLSVGDRVEVSGRRSERPAADSYRKMTDVGVLRPGRVFPLAVRKLP